ncbi:hypothetical protein GCM10020001_116630 [Nonomuraea salmonea]
MARLQAFEEFVRRFRSSCAGSTAPAPTRSPFRVHIGETIDTRRPGDEVLIVYDGGTRFLRKDP